MSEDDHKKFRVAEIFGPTIQGEGALIGAQTHFVRLGGCDYRCSWCDSMHAVDPAQVAQLAQLTVPQILDCVEALEGSPEWITLSGGNPALLELGPLLDGLRIMGFRVAVETQGTIYKQWLLGCDLVTVSPKPPSSGNVTKDETLDAFMQNFAVWADVPKVVLKVVVFDDADFDYARDIMRPYGDLERWVQVGNPEVDPCHPPKTSMLIERLGWLSDRILRDPDMHGVRVTPQLHTLIWGNERGH